MQDDTMETKMGMKDWSCPLPAGSSSQLPCGTGNRCLTLRQKGGGGGRREICGCSAYG